MFGQQSPVHSDPSNAAYIFACGWAGRASSRWIPSCPEKAWCASWFLQLVFAADHRQINMMGCIYISFVFIDCSIRGLGHILNLNQCSLDTLTLRFAGYYYHVLIRFAVHCTLLINQMTRGRVFLWSRDLHRESSRMSHILNLCGERVFNIMDNDAGKG